MNARPGPQDRPSRPAVAAAAPAPDGPPRRASRKAGVTLARTQESRIRHLHRTLDAYLDRP